jgi:hypothetical protein
MGETVVISGGTTTVKLGNGAQQRITLNQSTLADIVNNRPLIVPQDRDTSVIAKPVNPIVKTGGGMGVQGQVGPAGPSAQGIAPINFSYGDASSAIFTPSQAGTFTLVRLIITTAFNGVNSSLKLGTAGQSEAILAAAQNDPATIGEYENTPDLHVAANTAVLFTITPGAGASQGAGTIYLVFVPD